MHNYTQFDPSQWKDSVFDLVGNRTYLITCGDFRKSDFNTMTASWGMMGILWNRPVAEIVVRPTRHTHTFLERYHDFSLCFLPQDKKKIMDFCGSKSGRNVDKVKECDLHPAACKSIGSPYFEEAEIVVECRTISKSRFALDQFEDKSIDKNYPNKDYHTRYIGQILGIWAKTA